MGRSDAEKNKIKNMLKDWCKRPENRLCADCSLKQPGWASTNLGVVVCIHCSGIHRKMGVHISFVKSITLDDWQPKLAKSFIAQGGNLHINAKYEANLPKGIKPTDPTDMRCLETFIRAKYEHKKWFSAKGKKKKKKRKEASDSESESEDSSDSESSEPKKKAKKVDKGDRLRKSQRKKRRPRPAPAKKTKPTKPKKGAALNPPVKVATPAEDVPDLLDFGSMKLQTTEPTKNDEFNIFSDFSPRGSSSPPSFIPGMADKPVAPQPAQTQQMIDPFQQPAQPAAFGTQSATDKVMNLFKQTQQPQRNHNANIFTQISGPSPGFGSNFQQQGMQQRPMQGFPQQQQQQRPMQGFQQQQRSPMQMQGFQQQRPMQGFQQQQPPPKMGFGRGFQQTQQQQMGFGAPRQNQTGFQQQPMSGFGSAPTQQQQQSAFASFGNVQKQNNSFGFI